MAAVPVVEVVPDRQDSPTLRGVFVGSSVSPFAQGGLDVALVLAVGRWTIGPGELLCASQRQASGTEGCRVEGRSVVAEHGPVKRANLRDAIETVDVIVSNGHFHFSSTDHGGLDSTSQPRVMLRWVKGAWQIAD